MRVSNLERRSKKRVVLLCMYKKTNLIRWLLPDFPAHVGAGSQELSVKLGPQTEESPSTGC